MYSPASVCDGLARQVDDGNRCQKLVEKAVFFCGISGKEVEREENENRTEYAGGKAEVVKRRIEALGTLA